MISKQQLKVKDLPDWLKEIVKDRWVEERLKYYPQEKLEWDSEVFLSHLFVWKSSPEGKDFWEQVNTGVFPPEEEYNLIFKS